MQGSEAVFVAEVRAHVIPQQVAHWWEKGTEKDMVKQPGSEKKKKKKKSDDGAV